MTTLHDKPALVTSSAHRRADLALGESLRCVRFTFDVEAGALRRSIPDVLARAINDSGMDVSWTDRRSGLFGIVRRFTVVGSTYLVGKLIDELATTIGWEPGSIALPAL